MLFSKGNTMEKGFTLIELMIVIAIIGILTVMVIGSCVGGRRLAMAADAPVVESGTMYFLVSKDSAAVAMKTTPTLEANVIYFKEGDWADDDIDTAFAEINYTIDYFVRYGISKSRLIPTFTNVKEWRQGVVLDKGQGLYIVLQR
jgi:prepilin-type N-terminal cleavage/methylation domain-containing protein